MDDMVCLKNGGGVTSTRQSSLATVRCDYLDKNLFTRGGHI